MIYLAVAFRVLVFLLPGSWLRALLTLFFPSQFVEHGPGPYLSRWLVRRERGRRVYLHFFHAGDADPELHNHPWAGRGVVLAWGYREERRVGRAVVSYKYPWGAETDIRPDTFHRVDLLRPEKGCWSVVFVTEPVQTWGFWDRETGRVTPWEEHTRARGHRSTRRGDWSRT